MFSKLGAIKVAAAIVGSAAFGFSGGAHAATITFDFTTTSSPYEIKKNFVESGLGLEVWANTVVVNPDDTLNVTPVPDSYWQDRGIAQWEHYGLGLKSKNDDSHTVDSSGLNDLLLLTFTSSVKIISVSFNYAGVLTHSYDNFAFFADLGNDGLLDDAGDLIFDHQDIGAGAISHSGTYVFGNSDDYVSNVFGIGAIWDQIIASCTRRYHYSYCTKYTLFDSFKLATLEVEIISPSDGNTEVPLPAGVILLLSGLAGMGFLNRFNNKTSA